MRRNRLVVSSVLVPVSEESASEGGGSSSPDGSQISSADQGGKKMNSYSRGLEGVQALELVELEVG